MFNDIFKLLTEENEKILKAASGGLKCLFTFAFSSGLYIFFFGPYDLISLTDVEALKAFVTSGRVFICIFFASVIYAILFLVLPTLTDFIFNNFENNKGPKGKLDRKEGELIIKILKLTRMVDIRERGRKIILMKNAELMYEYAEAFSTRDAPQKARRILDNFTYEIIHPFIVFCLYYFTLLHEQYRAKALTGIIILFAALLFIVNRGLSQMLELLCRSSNLILSTIEDGRIYNRTMELLQQNFQLTINTKKKSFFDFTFMFDSQSIGVKCVPIRNSLKVSDAEFIVRNADLNKQHLIVISRNPISQEALAFLQLNEQKATFISVRDTKDLEEKLDQIIKTTLRA